MTTDPGIITHELLRDNEALWIKGGFASAGEFLEYPLSISGCCSISIFDGCGGMSLALEIKRVPTVCPWEVEKDNRLDVVKNAVVLWQLANSRRVSFSWLAMPCRSWTLARKPLLRSLDHLDGEPWVALLGSWKQISLVDDGNILILFTAMFIMMLLRAQCRFALENPLRSLAWWHPLLRWIAKQTGVIYTHFDMCEYGAPWRKTTCVLHDTPFLSQLKRGQKNRSDLLVLRGKVWYEGEWVFRTALASQYPPGLCQKVASLVSEYGRGKQTEQACVLDCHGIPNCGETTKKAGIHARKRKVHQEKDPA